MEIVVIGMASILLLLTVFPLLGSTQFLDSECGTRSPLKLGPRIVNGKVAVRNSSPWMAFLHTSSNQFICGGTLISRSEYIYIFLKKVFFYQCFVRIKVVCFSSGKNIVSIFFLGLVLTAAHCFIPNTTM